MRAGRGALPRRFEPRLHGGVKVSKAFCHGIGDTGSINLLRDADVLGPTIMSQAFDDERTGVVVDRPAQDLGRCCQAALGLWIKHHPDFTIGHAWRVAFLPPAVKLSLVTLSRPIAHGHPRSDILLHTVLGKGVAEAVL